MENSPANQKKRYYYFKLSILALLGILISTYIYSNSIELLFNKDIAFADSVQKFQSSSVLNGLQKAHPGESDAVGDYGKPNRLKFSDQDIRFEIIPAIKSGNDYLQRQNTVQILYVGQSKKGLLGDIVIYASRDWRTISNPEKISIDDNFFVDTNKDWRYMFRVVDKQIVEYGDTFVAADTGKQRAFLVVDDKQNHKDYVFQGDYINLQNIER